VKRRKEKKREKKGKEKGKNKREKSWDDASIRSNA